MQNTKPEVGKQRSANQNLRPTYGLREYFYITILQCPQPVFFFVPPPPPHTEDSRVYRLIFSNSVCVTSFSERYNEPQIGICSLNRRSPKMWTYTSSSASTLQEFPVCRNFYCKKEIFRMKDFCRKYTKFQKKQGIFIYEFSFTFY